MAMVVAAPTRATLPVARTCDPAWKIDPLRRGIGFQN
jgi:hypothetical protein